MTDGLARRAEASITAAPKGREDMAQLAGWRDALQALQGRLAADRAAPE